MYYFWLFCPFSEGGIFIRLGHFGCFRRAVDLDLMKLIQQLLLHGRMCMDTNGLSLHPHSLVAPHQCVTL